MLDTARLNSTSNLLLGFMVQGDRDLLGPHLHHVELNTPEVLEQPNEPIPFVYFPEAGLVSIVGDATIVDQIEIGIIGREGMTGLKVVLGDDRSPYQTLCKCPARA